MEPILQINDLSKHFPGVKALDRMQFDLFPGEVHILAGENGAGKSTLCKCLLGDLKPDGGQIILYGNKVTFSSPGEALAHGIGAVYQEFTLVPWLTVSENIFFNREPRLLPGTGLINTGKMNREAERILRDLSGADADVTRKVKHLGIAEQQTTEIAKMLSQDPKIMIFDEPTAALSDKEVDSLFHKIRELKSRGIGIIYISHRLQEYRRIGDRVTVMRDGKYIDTKDLSDLTDQELISKMIGREADTIYSRENLLSDKDKVSDAKVLQADRLSDRQGKVKDCSLTVKRGEIVGLAGLVGSGRTELARLLAGIDRPASGRVLLHGKDMTGRPVGELIHEGLGLLPEDRKEQGLAMRAPVKWNITAAGLDKIFPSRTIQPKTENDTAARYVEKLDIAVPGVNTKASSLSGGNQQKVVIAKWLLADTDFVIFDEPTRGIDVGAKMEIYRLMEDMAARGNSVLMISSELPEIMAMSDRIYVMKEGRIIRELKGEEKDEETLGRLMISDEADSEAEAEPGTKTETKPEADPEEHPGVQPEVQSDLILKGRNIGELIRKVPPGFYMLILLSLLFGAVIKDYYTPSNLGMILRQAAPLLVIACGQTLIILTQGTDLSLGAIVSLTCVLWVSLLNWGIPMVGAVGITLLAGLLCGVLNGIIAAKIKIPVFITTLGTQNIFKSAALLLCGSLTVYYNHPVFRAVAVGEVLFLSRSAWIALALFLFTFVMLEKTTFGKKIRALGGNPEAIDLAGGSRTRSMIKTFAFAGLFAGIGGLLICCRIESGNPNAGNGLEFSAVAAVLLGGTSLREGHGGVGGTVFGVLLIQVLKSGLMQAGVSSIYQNAIIGTFVLCAIITDSVLRYRDHI